MCAVLKRSETLRLPAHFNLENIADQLLDDLSLNLVPQISSLDATLDVLRLPQ